MKFNTKLIHGGQSPEPLTGAIMYPIFYTSTYAQKEPGKAEYEYSRTSNPTRVRLEKALASLENGNFALAFTSGMAAANAVVQTLKQGDHILCGDDLYGGTYRLFSKVYEKFGVSFSQLDLASIDRLQDALSQKKASLLWFETPTNPLLKIVDIQKVCEVAHRYGTKVLVDNTFASPYLQNPLDLGADIVLHSTTKYLGGHSDVVGGALITNDADLHQRFAFFLNAAGGNPSPMDCWLVLRGLKTLGVRMKTHCENARKIANYLAQQPWVKTLHYPGNPKNPQYEIAKKQMRDFGGMISLVTTLSLQQSVRFVQSTHYFYLAESLGGVESLIEHPASMTHASIPKEIREASGLEDGLIRISVGIEDVEDLLEDLAQAYRKAIN